VNIPRTRHQDIRYWKHRRRLFTCQSSHGAFWIRCYASSTSTDGCLTFEEEKLPSACIYDGYGNNVCVCISVAYEMLVLNGYVRHNAMFTKSIFDSEFRSFHCTKKKKLNASNIAFLQSLGFETFKK